MKRVFSIFSILLLVFIFLAGCGSSTLKLAKTDDNTDTEVEETDTATDNDNDTEIDPEPADTASNCGDRNLDEGEVCDGNAMECSEIDPSYTGGYAICNDDCSGWDISGCHSSVPEDPTNTEPTDDPSEEFSVFNLGQYSVAITDIKSNKSDAPRDFRIYEPTGAEGPVPVIHFLHGFMYKDYYYDDFLTHLASHGFIVVSSQSDHGVVVGIGGDTSIEEAAEVVSLINWLKQNLQANLTVTADFENFGVSGHSRGGKVTNRVLNIDPTIAKSFFGVDPVDAAAKMQESKDPESLNDPVQFTGASMFLGTEKGKEKYLGQNCAPEGVDSAKFYASYPSPSHHIIAAGVGHADMVDPDDVSACGTYCSACVSSGDTNLNRQLISYIGGLMTAFFNSTLKGETEFEDLLNDSSTHPFATTVVEHK